ncbi:MAG: hypothetical protein IJU64_06265 [Bacilli bacterium]|nr:hypothetical protein [Bacilli bacterium]
MKTSLRLLTSIAAMTLLASCGGYSGGTGGGAMTGAVLTGVGLPKDNIGQVGGIYLDIQSGLLYIKGQDGKWAPNSKIGGPAFYSGDKAPDKTLGANDDVYLDFSSGKFYVKANGEWVEKNVFVPSGDQDPQTSQDSSQGGEGNSSQDSSQGGGQSQGGGGQSSSTTSVTPGTNALVKSANNLDGHSFYLVADAFAMSTTPKTKVDDPNTVYPWYLVGNGIQFVGESIDSVTGLTSFLFTKNATENTYKISAGQTKLVGYVDSTTENAHYSISMGDPTSSAAKSEDWTVTISPEGVAEIYVDLGNNQKVYLEYYKSSFCGHKAAPTDAAAQMHLYNA